MVMDYPKSSDLDIGTKIKIHRRSLKITQGRLAKFVGCTTQQIQKYEGGCTRISIPVFLKICTFLNTHPNYFFSNFLLCDNAKNSENGNIEVKLLSLFRALTNEKVKEKVVNLIEAVVSNLKSE
ncbi:MAG: helix-turn-helix domain-containing protein [Holosporales bacterium]|jgi:transcriptional regulator with XRE-family HTH domain|nr:helix-turn-helix domain-containing protein [Holosporales bacterium]